jgi:DNA-directed RNA polymerase subunit M/transcription elongation factor TFIIS
MAIAFCPACDRLVYTSGPDSDECPVCSGPLAETEETISKRVIYLESSPPDTVIVTDLPARRSESKEARDKESKKAPTMRRRRGSHERC